MAFLRFVSLLSKSLKQIHVEIIVISIPEAAGEDEVLLLCQRVGLELKPSIVG